MFFETKIFEAKKFLFREARDPERTFGVGWREHSWLTLVNIRNRIIMAVLITEAWLYERLAQ